MLYMPEKKLNVITQLFGAFQKKKYVCDDIVTAADKVIENYIYSKNKLIRKVYAPNREKRALIWSSVLAISCVLISIMILK